MLIRNISEFKRGWFIGNFEPSLLKANFEVMLRNDKRGFRAERHFHKLATEYNVIAFGKYNINGKIYSKDDVFVIRPYLSIESECLGDGAILCVKDMSVPNDKYMGDVLNIVIPMAGRSSRFYNVPKPLIPVNGRPMIERVVENLKPKREHRFIFICLKEHRKGLEPLLSGLGHVIWIDEVTEGSACTVLKAKDLINNNDPLLISDCDQLLDMDLNPYYASKRDATIMTVKTNVPWCSYIKLKDGRVTETAEKRVISDTASCGKHLFKHGKYFVEAAEKMIKAGKKTNNEYYITPVYNEMLDKDIGIYEARGWHDIGNPQNLKEYLENSNLR